MKFIKKSTNQITHDIECFSISITYVIFTLWCIL